MGRQRAPNRPGMSIWQDSRAQPVLPSRHDRTRGYAATVALPMTPAPTVLFERSSTRMNEPVARLSR
jgi:hypothetical protein